MGMGPQSLALGQCRSTTTNTNADECSHYMAYTCCVARMKIWPAVSLASVVCSPINDRGIDAPRPHLAG
jgi:hypothetical protein